MKKLLSILIAAAFTMPVFAAEKKNAPKKPEVEKKQHPKYEHKKAPKPEAPAAKKSTKK
jgi:hypothetical protein